MPKRIPRNPHLTVRLNQESLDELAHIEQALRDDPHTAPMLRGYREEITRGQVVRWAIAQAWRSLQAEAREG